MRKTRFFIIGILFLFFSLTFVSAEILFIRGDANFDQKLDLADSVFINNYLYKGGPPPYCMDAADVNDDGKVDLSDGVYLNNYLYLGTGSPPPSPYPNAGIDPTPDTLTCGPDGQGGVCQSSFCDIGIKESAEGPGGSFCACSDSKGDAGFEECYDYKTKSTATIPQFLFNPAKQATDYCKDSQTLIEVAIDCEWASQDILDFKEKNCNDLNVPGPWSSYYCEDNEVKRRRTLPDYECGNGACYIGGGGYEEDILSRLGNSDYCAVKKSKCGVGCAFEEYDCDYNSECATGLVCLGPEGGAADGCCKSGQIWDTTNFQCDDCKPTDGPCCDSKGKFKPDTVICNNNLGTEYSCRDGNCLDSTVYKKVDIRYCSGKSYSCNGVRAEATSIEEYCDSTQFCSGSTTWGSTKPSCKNAQCIDGECCDNTCGVYTFKGNDLICDFKWDEGCPWGTDLGNDAGKRSGGIVCSGTSNTCGDGPLRWRDWSVKKDCLSNEYCAISSIDGTSYCRTIDCAQDSDCGTDEWLDETFCKNNDVYDKQRIWACNNPGKKESFCSSIIIDRKKEDCPNGCETLSPTSARCKGAPPPATCTDGIKNQDETDVDCGGTKCSKCANTKSCKVGGDCQSNYCNPSTLKCESPPPGTCSDGIKNQDETSVDCGGICSSQGKKCPNTQPCKINTDCQSNYCNPSTLKCENPPATCTDNDKDGYGTSGSTGCSKSGIDCNDNNANINPGATEICGNGVDENCNGNGDDACCSNECSPQGATRCSSSSVRQSCGNYDADSCLEWGGDLSCQYGCSNNQCNPSPSCTDRLYAYWKFNDVVKDLGRITDSSETDHAGTLHTFDSFDKSVSGIQGFAQSFDGINDYFEVSHSPLLEPGTGSFSISFWVYPETTGENRMILSKVNGTLGVKFKGYAILLTDGGNLYAGFGDGDRRTEVYSPVASFQWTNFVIVKDDPTDKVLIYKNGALVTSVSDPSQDVSYLVNIFVGRAYGPFKAFKGRLDEFAIFKRSLSPEEVRAFYTNGANARNLC